MNKNSDFKIRFKALQKTLFNLFQVIILTLLVMLALVVAFVGTAYLIVTGFVTVDIIVIGGIILICCYVFYKIYRETYEEMKDEEDTLGGR